MKSIVFSFIAGFSILSANATVLTVSNNSALPGSPGQYATISAAVSAASNSDTILIQGSATAYSSGITINKSLTLIGPGYNPQTASGYKAEIGAVIDFGNGSSNSKLIGLTNFSISFSNTFAISNIVISRCELSGTSYLYNGSNTLAPTGLIIENCYFNQAYLSLAYGAVTIRNNVFYSGYVSQVTSGTLSHVIKNNAFLCGTAPLYNMEGAIVENNIFFNNFPAADNNNCTFNNNYVYGTDVLPFGTNVGSGNITDQNAIYLTFLNCNTAFDYADNLRPINGASVKNAGTDATDIGPTGGASPIYPYVTGPLTGEPAIPQVQQITIPVSSVPAGGTLNINVKARKRN